MENLDDMIDFDNEFGFDAPGNKKENKKDLGPVEPTLIANMERISELAQNSKLCDAFYKDVDECLQFVSDKMGVTKSEALLLSLFLEMSNSDSISTDRICRFLRCSNLRMMGMQKDIDNLRDKGFLKISSHNTPFNEDRGYSIPKKLTEAVLANKPFKPDPITGLTIEELFDHIGDTFEAGSDYIDVVQEVSHLIAKNKKLPFAQKFNKNLSKELSKRDQFMFLLFCNRLVNEYDDAVSERDWRAYFTRRMESRCLHEEMSCNANKLQVMGIVESNPDNGMFGPTFRLTTMAKSEYLEGLNLKELQTRQAKDLVKWDTFAEKHLYYNSKEQRQIEQISDLLQEDKFKEVQKRLEETGMCKGFACLFYGAPGTGKTETVNQLARLTGRDVMVIDVSQIKDKFVGESEKNIKEAFDRYRAHVMRCEKAPILLFNEADAVLGVRQEGARRAVDKMENSIQNIILQEMEALDGIMIATTNLTQNLDSAFERRFIYKVEFHKPSVEAKKAIWMSMVPTLSEDLAEELAERYDFSGGQIENIARKRAVSYVLTGAEPTAAEYFDYCDEELIQQKNQHKKVGFC